MKVGDTVAVNIHGATVANAKIVELGDGTATLVIPATKVVMGVRTELETTPAADTGAEHAILGLENDPTSDTVVNEAAVNADAVEVVEAPETPVAPAEPVAQTEPVVEPVQETTNE